MRLGIDVATIREPPDGYLTRFLIRDNPAALGLTVAVDIAAPLGDGTRVLRGLGDDWLRIGGCKLFAVGVPSKRSHQAIAVPRASPMLVGQPCGPIVAVIIRADPRAPAG